MFCENQIKTKGKGEGGRGSAPLQVKTRLVEYYVKFEYFLAWLMLATNHTVSLPAVTVTLNHTVRLPAVTVLVVRC